MADYIMLQGTSSHVGKSILTTALCRIFHQEGRKVVPFKAQNMALNSYVTKDGLEMGRAQVAQAEAAGLEPMVDMNPVLLKPTGNSCSQVVLMGKPVGNMSAREYHKGYSLKAFDAVKEALGRLDKAYDTIVIEGAGSPAEVNLKANDIVNMRVAKYLQAPVLLVADIDRGGALASLVGTLELLDEDERELVKGLVINKFRGDVSLLAPAVDFLEQKTGKPVLGIIPHIEQLGIDDEDSVSLEEKRDVDADGPLRIAVVQTPKISNFTDFDSLAGESDVALSYVRTAAELGEPDLILL
ncbi:MAG: cobyric acid synthase, partial [Selenomonadaceae bacterium]|nr:cobyric acid synthase [Selenomonadaceae bacterium]